MLQQFAVMVKIKLFSGCESCRVMIVMQSQLSSSTQNQFSSYVTYLCFSALAQFTDLGQQAPQSIVGYVERQEQLDQRPSQCFRFGGECNQSVVAGC